jgi:hypothetical protein
MLNERYDLNSPTILAVNGPERYGQIISARDGCSYGRSNARNDLADEEVHTTASSRWQKEVDVLNITMQKTQDHNALEDTSPTLFCARV